ncbi:MAG: hypothetical protein PVJ77_10770, partial [Desulfobacterales bacterium]
KNPVVASIPKVGNFYFKFFGHEGYPYIEYCLLKIEDLRSASADRFYKKLSADNYTTKDGPSELTLIYGLSGL